LRNLVPSIGPKRWLPMCGRPDVAVFERVTDARLGDATSIDGLFCSGWSSLRPCSGPSRPGPRLRRGRALERSRA